MARSLKDYYDIFFWINYFVYMLYVIFKYIMVIYLIITWAHSKMKDDFKYKEKNNEEPKRENNDASKAENTDESKGTNSEEPRSNINKTSREESDDVESKDARKKTACCEWFQPMKWMRWSVKQVFRKQLELEDKLGKKKGSTNQETPQDLESGGNGQSNIEEGPKIELNHRSTAILFTLIATFGLLAIGSALDVTLLSVTYACTEDPNINCYPRLINDADNAGLNISTDKPTEDCSFWNSEGVSDKVSFICYQFVLNVELFLAVIGGLSTVFVFMMRAVIGVLLWCIRKCGKKKCLQVARYVLVLILSGSELLMAIVGMVLQGTGTSVDNTNDTPGVIFFATHAAEILLVIGIIATLLLLPWEDYARKKTNIQTNNLLIKNHIGQNTLH